ncbi:hypothetical protein ACIRPK_28575, partial [Kitasatospora sp. NPDC101801]
MALAFAAVGVARWQRTGDRGDGAGFTVGPFARYPVHPHLYDVTAGLPGLGRVLGSAGGHPLGEVARDAVGAGLDGHVVFA